MAWTDPKTWVAAAKLTAAELNAHLRDNLVAAFPTGTEWDTWTPGYTNIAIENGTVTARYIQFGKMVYARWHWELGSSSTVSGTPVITLPTDHANSVQTEIVGWGALFDASGADYVGLPRLFSDDSVQMQVYNASSTYLGWSSISSTVPFTWATGDLMSFNVLYEAA